MAKSRNDILWRFLADTKSLDKGNKTAQSGFKATNKATSAMQGAMGMATKAAGALGLALGGREILSFASDAVQLAVAADEVESKFQAVYGITGPFTKRLSAWADMAGVTDTAAKELASTFGNLIQAQGFSSAQTEEMAESVATLAGDMASFNDSDPAEVYRELGQAIATTERDALRKYGITVAEAEVKTQALALAVADGRDEVTAADRAMASYNIIVKQAGKATGDLERTQDSLANRQRRVQATWKETQEEVGRKLIPVYEEFLALTEDLLPLLDYGTSVLGEYTGAAMGLRDAFEALTSSGPGGVPKAGYDMLAYGQTIARNVIPPVAFLTASLRRVGIEVLPETTKAVDGLAYSLREFRLQNDNVGLGGITQSAKDLDTALSNTVTTVETLADRMSRLNQVNLPSAEIADKRAQSPVSDAQVLADLIDLGAISGG